MVRDSNIRDRTEREGVRQPSDTIPERAPAGDQDGGVGHDLSQSERSTGETWCSGYTRVRIDRHC